MAKSLKQQIEEQLSAALLDFAGATGTNLDRDLEPRQRLTFARGGYLLVESDKKRGPGVACKVMQTNRMNDEIGNGSEGRSLIGNALVRFTGQSLYSNDVMQTVRDRDTLAEVVMANLLKVTLEGAVSDFTSGKLGYAALLDWLSTNYTEEVTTGEQAAPMISDPQAASGNTSTGSIVVNSGSAYTSAAPSYFTLQIATANTTPGSLADLTFRWKKDYGAYSSAIAATGNYQSLSDGVQIKFKLGAGQSFVAGDTWQILGSPTGLDFIGLFTQDYQLQFEYFAGV